MYDDELTRHETKAHSTIWKRCEKTVDSDRVTCNLIEPTHFIRAIRVNIRRCDGAYTRVETMTLLKCNTCVTCALIMSQFSTIFDDSTNAWVCGMRLLTPHTLSQTRSMPACVRDQITKECPKRRFRIANFVPSLLILLVDGDRSDIRENNHDYIVRCYCENILSICSSIKVWNILDFLEENYSSGMKHLSIWMDKLNGTDDAD